jgi:hypothetical protein
MKQPCRAGPIFRKIFQIGQIYEKFFPVFSRNESCLAAIRNKIVPGYS